MFSFSYLQLKVSVDSTYIDEQADKKTITEFEICYRTHLVDRLVPGNSCYSFLKQIKSKKSGFKIDFQVLVVQLSLN